MRYYIKAFRNYARSDGRASRKEMWMFIIFNWLALFVTAFADGLFGLCFKTALRTWNYGWLTLIYLLISLCPSICLRIRRLHDINKKGTWWALDNIPFVSYYVYYLYLFKKGDAEKNQYGLPEDYKGVIVQKSFCEDCGTEITVGSQFCAKCGKRLLVSTTDNAQKLCKCCGAKNSVDRSKCIMCDNPL